MLKQLIAMAFRLVLTRKFQKELEKVDSRYLPRIKTVLLSLQDDPYLGKKLEGELADLRSYRIGPYRILYKIKQKELIVLVITIGHRQGVY